MIARRGPVYNLLDLRLQDLDAGCLDCGKRLAEVVHDPENRWHAGAVVCIDCGREARLPAAKPPREGFVVRPSWRSPGLSVAACRTCRWTSAVTRRAIAEAFARKHVEAMHP